MSYTALKTLHILSMVLLFGTGLGSAFYKWMADRSGHVAHIAVTNRHVVLADWIFTTPTVIIQPLTGLWMVYEAGLPLNTPWIVVSLGLYALAGACWLPVVWLQLRLRALARQAVAAGTALPKLYWRYFAGWVLLGFPAFFAFLAVFWLMVANPL